MKAIKLNFLALLPNFIFINLIVLYAFFLSVWIIAKRKINEYTNFAEDFKLEKIMLNSQINNWILCSLLAIEIEYLIH